MYLKVEKSCNLALQVFTLQEYQKFRTETEILLISDLMKSLGGKFPLKIHKYLSIHFEN